MTILLACGQGADMSARIDAMFTVAVQDYPGDMGYVEIDCDTLIDGYDYHDAPSSIYMWLDYEEVCALIDKLQAVKAQLEERST